MYNRIEYADLKAMGATAEQLDTYSNTDPLTIYQTAPNSYEISGAISAVTDAAGVLDLLDALSCPDC